MQPPPSSAAGAYPLSAVDGRRPSNGAPPPRRFIPGAGYASRDAGPDVPASVQDFDCSKPMAPGPRNGPHTGFIPMAIEPTNTLTRKPPDPRRRDEPTRQAGF